MIDVVWESHYGHVEKTFTTDHYRYSLLVETVEDKMRENTVQARSGGDYHKRCQTCLNGADECPAMGDVSRYDKPAKPVEMTEASSKNLSPDRSYSESVCHPGAEECSLWVMVELTRECRNVWSCEFGPLVCGPTACLNAKVARMMDDFADMSEYYKVAVDLGPVACASLIRCSDKVGKTDEFVVRNVRTDWSVVVVGMFAWMRDDPSDVTDKCYVPPESCGRAALDHGTMETPVVFHMMGETKVTPRKACEGGAVMFVEVHKPKSVRSHEGSRVDVCVNRLMQSYHSRSCNVNLCTTQKSGFDMGPDRTGERNAVELSVCSPDCSESEDVSLCMTSHLSNLKDNETSVLSTGSPQKGFDCGKSQSGVVRRPSDQKDGTKKQTEVSVVSGRSGNPAGTSMDSCSPSSHMCYEHPCCTSRGKSGEETVCGETLNDTVRAGGSAEDTVHNNVNCHPPGVCRVRLYVDDDVVGWFLCRGFGAWWRVLVGAV